MSEDHPGIGVFTREEVAMILKEEAGCRNEKIAELNREIDSLKEDLHASAFRSPTSVNATLLPRAMAQIRHLFPDLEFTAKAKT